MKNRLYRKLALSNIWRNRTLYIPYLLGCAVSVFCLYTFCMMAYNPGVFDLASGANMAVILWLGIIVMCVFTFFFMRYANGFLFKRRLRELGLYSVLGLEKKHIARVLRNETVVSAALSLGGGLALGISLGRLMFLLVQAMVQRPIPFRSGVSMPAMTTCIVYFSAIFALLNLLNSLHMRRLNPAALLMGAQQGEREPQSRWILAVIGAALMGVGYYMALTVSNPMQAIFTFFIAVVLVILGTYALFTAGSIVILKALKKVKRIYYKRSNFITLSGMLYRMKQHAVGLATICILSTMVIITLGTTTALYVGQRDMLEYVLPYEFSMDISYQNRDEFSSADRMMKDAQAETGVTVTALLDYEAYSQIAYIEENRISARGNIDTFADSTWDSNRILGLVLMDARTYADVSGESVVLAPDEALLFIRRDVIQGDTLHLGSESFCVARRLNEFARMKHADITVYNQAVIVLSDDTNVRRALSAMGAADEKGRDRFLQWDVQGDSEACLAYSRMVEEQVKSNRVSYGYESRFLMEEAWLEFSAGFLFLGLFIGLMFLMATTLIIYFKQISEGYSDHDRFLILQKVGMDKAQVKSAINRQVLSVFALPLLVAGLHTLGAMPMIRQLLAVFGLSNTDLINLCVLMMGLCFAVIYAFVYLMTIKAYYRIVRWD